MKKGWLILISIVLFGCNANRELTSYVDPFIGTQHEGHAFPGATLPGGMVQPSPESYNDYYVGYEMDHVAGYQYNDPYIMGFTQTHINGAGCPTLSDILLMPYCGRDIDPSLRKNFCSKYAKENELAKPGYYSVYLDDNKVAVELTATPHVAYHRYRYDNSNDAKLLIDLQYGVSWDVTKISENVLEATQAFEDQYTLTGYRQAKEWAKRKLFYVVKFSAPIATKLILPAPDGKAEVAPRYLLSFDMDGKELEVMVGVSTVSVDQAKANLAMETSGWKTFDKVHADANEKWNDMLGMIEIEGSDSDKTAFYTSMYKLFVQPHNIADVDGSYRAQSDSVCVAGNGKFYTDMSLWDTYRAANPMYTILTPDAVSDYVTSLMDSYTNMIVDPTNPKEANKYLPRWQLWGHETHTMVANHAVAVIADAYLKGIKSKQYTDEQLFEALYTTVTKPHYRNHVELVDKYGYIPSDVKMSDIDDGRETVSRLLENIYDDYCVAKIAEKLGKTEQQKFLEKRAQYYRNVYDTTSGFMRGRLADGSFKPCRDVTEVVGEWLDGSDFTEGNAWHYLFHVQHDVDGMIDMMGGKDAVAQKLDSMFFTKTKPEVKTLVWNIYGTLGQYWHGNEPCHHVVYLYKYTDKGYVADALLKYLTDNYHQNRCDGLKGNDDCGQMSAWYMFASMGLYPVNPCGGEYILGAPQLPKAVVNLQNGNKFTIKANNLSDVNYYVKSVSLNGKALTTNYITHNDILSGGELVFEMCDGTTIPGFKPVVL